MSRRTWDTQSSYPNKYGSRTYHTVGETGIRRPTQAFPRRLPTRKSPKTSTQTVTYNQWSDPSNSSRSYPMSTTNQAPRRLPKIQTANMVSCVIADNERISGYNNNNFSHSHIKLEDNEAKSETGSFYDTSTSRPSNSRGRSSREPLHHLESSLEETAGKSTSISIGKAGLPSQRYSGLSGLSNLGNTCFMNSVMQCLCNTPRMALYCLSDDYKRDINSTSKMRGNLIKAYAEVMKLLWSGQSRVVTPSHLKSEIQRYAPRFTGYNQQDSQELLRYLVEGLHEDVNRVKGKPRLMPYDEKEDERLSPQELSKKYWDRYKQTNNSFVLDLFVGQLCSTLTCSICDNKSYCFDPFWDLSVPIPKGNPTIEQCIELFMKKEVLDGDEKPTCSRCKKRQRSYKAFSLQMLPKVLVVHLKRFSGDRFRSKLSTEVRFTHRLDLRRWLADSSTEKNAEYRLYGISNHSGTCSGGHYTAYAQHEPSGSWYCFDDSRVYQISPSRIASPEAYVLFFEKV